MEETTPHPSTNAIPESLKRNVVIMDSLLLRMPSTVLCRPFIGPLAAMEAARIVKATQNAGGELMVITQAGVQPLVHLKPTPQGGELLINGRPCNLRWAVFHRSSLAVFNHIFLATLEADQERYLLVLPAGVPLTEPVGLALITPHLRKLASGQETPDAFYQELEGVANLMKQGNPMEREANHRE